MDKELEQYYYNYFDLFKTPGWKEFVKEIEQEHSRNNSIDNLNSIEDLYLAKGKEIVFNYILSLENYIEEGYSSVQAV